MALVAALAAGAQSLTVATYNIRNENQGDYENGNGWSTRLSPVCDLILMQGFDIFGAQEVRHSQLQDMLARLPGYAYTGVGRDDGATQGEYSPIFYRDDKLELLRSGTFWLSTDTSSPNRGWDAALPRICSWGEMRVRESGKIIFFFNTHFDHVGVEARRQSARLILDKIAELAAGAPAILTGDLNVDQDSDSYALLAASPLVEDCYTAARAKFAPGGTFNAFDPRSPRTGRIDHIFVSPGIGVERYGILTSIYWNDGARTPSDHYPVMARIMVND
jgi:endonuclease/exonuclease/phosphatase family metal-dependent hydrolase